MLFNIQKAFLAVSCRQSRLPQPFSILIGQEMPPGYRNKAATVAKSYISHNHKCPWPSCAVRRALFNHIKNTVNTSHCSSQLVNPTPKPQYSCLNIFPFYMRAKSGRLSIEDNHTAFTLGQHASRFYASVLRHVETVRKQTVERAPREENLGD